MRTPNRAASSSQAAIDRVLSGGGQMGALMRSIDWSETALGPVDTWPQSLRTVLSVLLGSDVPVFVLWGPELIQFYNDRCLPILAAKHPRSMGQRARDCWNEIWDVISPMYQSVLAGGSTMLKDGFLALNRNGALEECYFDYAYSPIRGESGAVMGIYAAVAETTDRVIGDRRLAAVRELSIRTALAEDTDGVLQAAQEVLAQKGRDVPFALLYQREENGARLVLQTGLATNAEAAPAAIALHAAGTPWPLSEVLREGREQLVDLAAGIGVLRTGPWPEAVRQAMLIPVGLQGSGEKDAVLIVGLSPRLPPNEPYREFLRLLSRQLAADVVRAQALEHERRRAAEIAELDRQKTAFFGNVSHEFRTPLALILGPTEDALASPAQVLEGEQLERVHGNAQRLLKLVNTLLEFSRFEAGKSRAAFAPTDLSLLTAGLANAFETAMQRASLRLIVDCPPLPEPVWVDRSLWEKVVLNLVSNAFKFTMAGHVAVRQRWIGDGVELTVEDTGTGIAPEELSRVFERFHRGDSAQGRSHEGTGIGLSLVHDAVTLHGGHVSVQSTPGVGSTFSVVLPARGAHVPSADLRLDSSVVAISPDVAAYVREAAHWVPHAFGDTTPPHATDRPSSASGSAATRRRDSTGHVLLVEDNADMRAYLRNVLEPHFTVEAVPDGREALDAVGRRLPDVVLSDVMMPRMDGIALTRALRKDARTAHVPVLLLSARAGEEATIEGLDAGADDYVVKPFGARELIARLQGAIKVAWTDAERRRVLRLMSEVLESMGDGFFSVDADWRFTAVNPSYERLSHTRRADVLGRVLWDLFPSAGNPESEYWKQLTRCMSDRMPVQFVEYYAPLSLWTDVRANPTPDGGIAVFFRDISAEKKAEAALLHQSQFEQQLIGIVSHDLRNPLNAIRMGAAMLARHHELSDRVIETAVRIQSSAERANGMVKDLLDFTQARLGGGIPIHPVAADIHALAHGVLLEVEAAHPDRVVHYTPSGNGQGVWDPDRLAQAVQNLVTNALRYSPSDSPVRVSTEGNEDAVVLSIHNAGAPIPATVREHLFEPFQRGHPAGDPTTRSVGLGLYIVKQIVCAHNGTIDVQSAESDGTTFIVRLPRSAA